MRDQPYLPWHECAANEINGHAWDWDLNNEEIAGIIAKYDASAERIAYLEKKLAEIESECNIWFGYVDPFDMYPAHDNLWKARQNKSLQ